MKISTSLLTGLLAATIAQAAVVTEVVTNINTHVVWETHTVWVTETITRWTTIQSTIYLPPPQKTSTSAAQTTQAPTVAKPATSVQATSTPTPTPTPTPSSTPSGQLNEFEQSVLDEHNKLRALHGVGSLTWDSTLAKYAQDFADSYDCSGILTHSGGPYGENLALGYQPVSAVDAWYDEIDHYDYSNPVFSSSTGHFTQVVWKDTQRLGCGLKYCGTYWNDYVVCSYDPPGNYRGEFADNVLPLVRSGRKLF